MNVLIPLIALCILGCTQQKTIPSLTCNERITLQFDESSTTELEKALHADTNLNSAVVHFQNTFSDTIKAYLNEELVFNAFVSTNTSTASTDAFFGFQFSDKSKSDVLKIVSSRYGCIDFKPEPDYKIIYLFYTDQEKWIVRFSNTYYLHN